MNRTKTITCAGGLLLAATVCLLLSATNAVAGENPTHWRPIYDLVMRWINFLILAFIIVKFGKAPLMNFLRGQQEAYEEEIGQLEKEKDDALVKVKKTQTMLAESNAHFAVITERIVAEGEKKKQAIIDEAGEESRLMIEGAKRKIGSQLDRAKEQFREELVDSAVALAIERLVGEFTKEDNEKSIRRYVESIETA